MFSLCKQTHPATGIEHAINCNFFDTCEQNLVTAAANILKVYKLIQDIEPQLGRKRNLHSNRPKSKLECVGEYPLFGNVASLQKVNFSNSPRDALLVAFSDAKLSVVEYDPENHDLKSRSLHHFEEDDMKDGWTRNHHAPIVRTDPENRCAVMAIYGRKLVVLPFKQTSDADTRYGNFNSKKPVLASYTITLNDIHEKINNVIDIQFLHGYSEPTLLILYDPIKTFSGRLAVCRDTCAIAVVSLHLQQKINSVIWQVCKLPFDCTRAVPIPKPLGGALIFSVNALIYLEQHTPPLGVSLNSITESTTNFPLQSQTDVTISLDCAQVAVLTNDRLVLSLNNGELYVLTLVGVGCVRSFNFMKVDTISVLATSLCVCEDKFLFFGSRLGNSVLASFAEDNEPLMKRCKREFIVDEEEVVKYENVTRYIFEVCDSLINIGPCGNVSIGESESKDLELVTTSGHGRDGAISVLQRSIKPQIVTSITLPGYVNMWTVCHNDDKHAFLILSKEDGSIVIETGEEMNEVNGTGFSTEVSTVYATNLGGLKYIVQVLADGIRLLCGSTQLQHLPLDLGSPIIHASSADPYISLLSADKRVITLILHEDKDSARLRIIKSEFSCNSPVTTFCMYRDISGLFSNNISNSFTDVRVKSSKMDIESEEEFLYGVENEDIPTASKSDNPPSFKCYKSVEPSTWMFLVRDDSSLEIYSVPEFKLCFNVKNLCFGFDVLVNELESLPGLQTNTMGDIGEISDDFKVEEILMVGLGNQGSRPMLLVRLKNDLYIYEVFRFGCGTLKLRFKKVKHNLMYSPNNLKETQNSKFLAVQEKVPRMRYFSNVAGYSGVFVSGGIPYWLFLTSRGELRTHAMSMDGEVSCFASFNNVNCPNGFLHFNQKDELRVSVLPTHLTYDSPWPVRKVPLQCTPHFIQYHLESKTYCVVTSTQEPSLTYYKLNGEDPELCIEDKGENFPYPLRDTFTITLLSPVSWEIIPNTKIELEDCENVTCLKYVTLSGAGTESGLKGYLAIGTSYNYGEDVLPKGRILLYDVIEVVPEPGKPLTRNKFKEICSLKYKKPVTAISQVVGSLVAAVGSKIYVLKLNGGTLEIVSCIEAQFYTHQIVTIKNLILIADVYKSISLLRFQEKCRTLSLVSSDFRPCEVYAADYLVDNKDLGFLCSDSEKNLILYAYQPEHRESCGGQKLLRKADFHLGQNVNAFFRLKCEASRFGVARNFISDNLHITMFATLDGGLGYVLPISEKMYRQLCMLENILLTYHGHTCGLNPKEYRTVKNYRKNGSNPCRSIIDGELVSKFLHLAVNEKMEISDNIGTTLHELMTDLRDIQKVFHHF